MSAMSRKEVLEQAGARYCGRGKKGRSRLLDEICALCGYERNYASKLLSGVRSHSEAGARQNKRRLRRPVGLVCSGARHP